MSTVDTMTQHLTRRTLLKLVGAGGASGFALSGTAVAGQGGGGLAETDLNNFHRKTPWYVFDSLGSFEDYVTCMAEQSGDQTLYFYLAEYVGTEELTVVITTKPLDETATYQFTSKSTPCRVEAADFPNGIAAYARVK